MGYWRNLSLKGFSYREKRKRYAISYTLWRFLKIFYLQIMFFQEIIKIGPILSSKLDRLFWGIIFLEHCLVRGVDRLTKNRYLAIQNLQQKKCI
jgi:hypothetical protein